MSSGLFWRNFNFGQYKCFPHRSAYSTEIQGAKIHFFSDTEPLRDKVLYIYKINNTLQGERNPCPIIQVNDFELSYFSICRNRNQRGKENLRRRESIVARWRRGRQAPTAIGETKKREKPAKVSLFLWSRWDSNPLPFDCEPNALPDELLPRIKKSN